VRARISVRRHRRALIFVSLLLTLVVTAACTAARTPVAVPSTGASPWHPAPVVDGRPLRASAPTSWWNSPVPGDAPSNPEADAILRYMSTAPNAAGGCIHLSGAGNSAWGQPVYWARAGDPTYDVSVRAANAPVEVHSLRIPRGALAAGNNDGSMTVFDVERGYAVALTDAKFEADTNHWSASGATVTYLSSNGLDARTGRTSDPRNIGSHRGNNPADMMARLDEVAAGRVDHVLKVASGPETSVRFVFPMVGSDGSSTDPAAPPQGLRFRIKPSVDLAGLGLAPQALVIARALQQYGFYIGDSARVTALKLEDTRSEGRGQRWSIPPTALCSLPITAQYWDVLPEGYVPPAAG
jgi:hypothetical protein